VPEPTYAHGPPKPAAHENAVLALQQKKPFTSPPTVWNAEERFEPHAHWRQGLAKKEDFPSASISIPDLIPQLAPSHHPDLLQRNLLAA